MTVSPKILSETPATKRTKKVTWEEPPDEIINRIDSKKCKYRKGTHVTGTVESSTEEVGNEEIEKQHTNSKGYERHNNKWVNSDVEKWLS